MIWHHCTGNVCHGDIILDPMQHKTIQEWKKRIKSIKIESEDIAIHITQFMMGASPPTLLTFFLINHKKTQNSPSHRRITKKQKNKNSPRTSLGF